MKEVAETLYLQKRGDVWYDLRRVPTPLVPAIGKQFIKRSLGTGNLARAKRLRTVHELNREALFAAAERGASAIDKMALGGRMLPMEVLAEHVRSTINSMDREAVDYLLNNPVVDDDELFIDNPAGALL